MQEPIKVGIVNYLNTKPLLHGLQQLHDAKIIELVLDYPANVAQALLQNKIDIGLVPVAIMPQIPNVKIIGSHCIASNNNVASVCLFSKVPITEIKNVLLDYQSRTSVALVQILCKHYWKIDVNFLSASTNYIAEINNTTAAVIIGDRALENLENYEYVYDLAKTWNDFTNLPFVFAAWLSNKSFEADFLAKFEYANALGLQNISAIAQAINYSAYNLETYFGQNICYTLDAKKREAIDLFLQYNAQM